MKILYKYIDNIDDKSYVSENFNILKYDNIIYLNCSFNELIYLPILPNSLIDLHCYFNKINKLTVLPICLNYLFCYENKIYNLPILPNNLVYLNCYKNKLINLPKINEYKIHILYDNSKIKYINEYNLNTMRLKIYNYIQFYNYKYKYI